MIRIILLHNPITCVYVYIYIISIYITKILWFHPSAYYFTPPWGVSTNQGKDIRAYVNGFDFYFDVDFLNSPPFARESVKSPLRHCDSPIKCSNFAIFHESWYSVGEFQNNISLCNESLSCIFISLVGPRSSKFYL